MSAPASTLILPDTDDIQRYLELLYPDVPPDAWLVVSWADGQGGFPSQWFRAADLDAISQYIACQTLQYETYVGLGLLHPQLTPHGRGTSADVYAIPGLWIEFDHNGGPHTKTPNITRADLLTFIDALPFRFSLLVDSTGGIHAYLLFKEPWYLDTPAEHAAAQLLLQRFQWTMKDQALAKGFDIDSTYDLARVLRPAGTLHHKTGTPLLVTILHEEAIRYDPAELVNAPWIDLISPVYTPAPGIRLNTLADLTPIVQGCAWLQHCWDDRYTLSEPEWYAMLGIVGRCVDGASLAHQWSADYPQYDVTGTTAKLTHALQDAGPRRCKGIRHDLNAGQYCKTCPSWGVIQSPIVLGTIRPVLGITSSNGVTAPASTWGALPQWRDQLLRDRTKNGYPTCNVTNLGLILSNHPHWQQRFWWDAVRSTPMLDQDALSDDNITAIGQWIGLEEHLPISNLKLLERCILTECRKTPKDLLQLWLHSLQPWDGVPRLSAWLCDVAEVEKTAIGMAVSRLIPLSMVARALNPGCLYRYVIILEGPENTGKSSLVRALAGDGWYVELSMALESKEAHMMLQGPWVAEMAELDSLSRTEETRLKAFITMTEDIWIPKYSNYRVSQPRRTIFIGTTNEESYLKGQTGNTRFLPVKTGTIKVDDFRQNREQIFAEALMVYQAAPDTWWMVSDEALAEADVARALRRIVNVYEQPLHEWLEFARLSPIFAAQNPGVTVMPDETSWPEIAQYYLKIESPERWKDKALQMQIAQALRNLGWLPTTVWRYGRTTKIWHK